MAQPEKVGPIIKVLRALGIASSDTATKILLIAVAVCLLLASFLSVNDRAQKAAIGEGNLQELLEQNPELRTQAFTQ